MDAVAIWSQTHQQQGRSVLVLGDLNSTPWSRRVRRLLLRGNLQNSQQGYFWQTIWPAGLPAPLRVAIDHGLYSFKWRVLTCRIGPPLGSDHFPLQMTLVMKD
jgi:endonuclease/exonuclease/phosphatase (EEP) superfamily protein YafD